MITLPDPDSIPDLAWTRLQRWIRGYSWAQVAFLATLVTTIHMVPLAGAHWSSCRLAGATDWTCVAYFHVYEVPLTGLFIHHIIAGLRPISRRMLPYYGVLTLLQIVALFVFCTLESSTLLTALRVDAPGWEVLLLFAGCTGMLIDCGLGVVFALTQLLPALLGPREA